MKSQKQEVSNSQENLVPFQSDSLPDQNKGKVLYGCPRDVRQKDKTPAGKKLLETDTEATLCKPDEKPQLEEKTVRLDCRICRQLPISAFFDQPLNSHLNENKTDQTCFHVLFEEANRLRQERGGPKISRSQASKCLQDLLAFQEGNFDKDRPVALHNKVPRHSSANV